MRTQMASPTLRDPACDVAPVVHLLLTASDSEGSRETGGLRARALSYVLPPEQAEQLWTFQACMMARAWQALKFPCR
jgi:hypothetical protein